MIEVDDTRETITTEAQREDGGSGGVKWLRISAPFGLLCASVVMLRVGEPAQCH